MAPFFAKISAKHNGLRSIELGVISLAAANGTRTYSTKFWFGVMLMKMVSFIVKSLMVEEVLFLPILLKNLKVKNSMTCINKWS